MISAVNYLATTYDSGAYGASNYETGTTTGNVSANTSNSTGSASILTNTGFDLLLIVTLAASLIFVALVVRFWRRPSKPSQSVDKFLA